MMKSCLAAGTHIGLISVEAMPVSANAFNLYTLASTESWQRPSVRDIAVVRGLIPLTDVELAHRLDVDERTIRKWKSGQTRMVYTTWCCLCWPDWGCRSITLSMTEDTLPDATEYETAIVSPVSLPDIWKVVKIGQKPG